jgi:1,5-anhydro-D-fructose reductase (1,5-anhydro-D-mannitol-forming)
MLAGVGADLINVGIIGFGKMGQIRFQALRASAGAEVTTIFDEVARDRIDGITYVDCVEELINDASLSAVVICTPNCHNKPLTLACLEAGKHVFCEKPPAFTAEDVREIRSAELRSGKCLMYGFNHRHHESIRKMKQIVDGGDMGRILWMRGRYGKEVQESFRNDWRADPVKSGGGIMLDQGIHMLDLMLYLAGGFDEVQAMVSDLFWKIKGIEDNVFVNLRSSHTGVCASLHSTMTQWRYIFSLEVFLEGGALVLNGLKTSSGVYGDEDLAIKRHEGGNDQATFQSEEHIVYHDDTSWNAEMGHFLECIRTGESVALGNSADALAVMTVMDKVYGRT